MWKKMHRAIMSTAGWEAIDSYIGSYDHTKHCEHMLLADRKISFGSINSQIKVKFPDCGMDYSMYLTKALPL